MGKKLLCLAVAAMCVCSASFALPAYVARADAEIATVAEAERPEAIFLQGVTMTRDGDNYLFTYRFDKQVANAAGELNAKELFTVNGSKLSEISGSTLRYPGAGNSVEARVPASSGIVKETETTRVNVLGGLFSATNRVTTVRYIYDFYGLGNGNRIYRSDNLDDYDEVTVTSVSVPGTESQNGVIRIYFSDTITPKKCQDLQWTRNWLRSAYGETSTNPVYSNADIDLLYHYQVFDPEWENSISHMLLFGCEDYNGLKAYPANTGNIDMTPKTTVNGIELFDVRQLQESVAEEGAPYINKDGDLAKFSGSRQCFAIQIHFDQNEIQFILKGDSRDHDPLLGKIIDREGKEYADRALTFNENLRPDYGQTMVLMLRSGLLTPNGKMIKQDYTFIYNSEKKQWTLVGAVQAETVPDETLNNQEGYTDAELAELAKQN